MSNHERGENLPEFVQRALKSVDNPYEPPRKQNDIKMVCKALSIAWEALAYTTDANRRCEEMNTK